MTVILVWIASIGTTLVALTDDPSIKFGYAVITYFVMVVWTLAIMIRGVVGW